MGQLIDAGTAGVGNEPQATQQARLTQFHGLLQTLLPSGQQPVEDSGETRLLCSDDPARDYQVMSNLVEQHPARRGGRGHR